MQRPQFGPGKDHAVAVDDQIVCAHLDAAGLRMEGPDQLSAEADACFFDFALAGLGASRRTGAALAVAFLRSKYATRRRRFTLTRCCWPMRVL